MPVLAVGGEISTSGALVEEMMREVGGCAWRPHPRHRPLGPEERPEAFVRAVLDFVG